MTTFPPDQPSEAHDGQVESPDSPIAVEVDPESVTEPTAPPDAANGSSEAPLPEDAQSPDSPEPPDSPESPDSPETPPSPDEVAEFGDETAANGSEQFALLADEVEHATEPEAEPAPTATLAYTPRDSVSDLASVFGASVAGGVETAAGEGEEAPGDESERDAPADEEQAESLLEVVTDEELLEEEVRPSAPVESPYDRPGRWYVVHTQSGYEKKVKQNLEARTVSMNMEGSIHEVVIPMEDVAEFKGGKKVVVQKKLFPGYLLVRCDLDDDSWYVIRNTPGVTGFVGQGAKPSPLTRRDVEGFLLVEPEGEEAPTKRVKPRLEYEMGETVRVREGPFADFSGEVIDINTDQNKVKVLVNIFGRETPVELEFSQVAKL